MKGSMRPGPRKAPGSRSGESGREKGLERLQFLAGLEANGLAGRGAHLFAGARVEADASLAGLDVEDAETPQLDALAASEGVLHGLEDGFHGLLGLGSGDTGAADHCVDDVELDHACLPLQKRAAYARQAV